ncbi:hypothetical protein DXG01_008938 [Tephrocybe rancida]|nr:hypothetical protein DXG01_008938 [Tephrocybe rancida]
MNWAAAFSREDKPEGDQRHLMNVFTATAISLQTFILACIRYPAWIAKAQEEIDAVVGSERLPSFKDRPVLPYVEAVVREILRWRPAGTLDAQQFLELNAYLRFGLPHQSTASDMIEYNGKMYFIPKGSIIFAVPWAIEHDQTVFEEHDRFMPERFLDANGDLKSDYDTSAFGFGRRTCPGIPFAERTLWIAIATMLWTFNIRASEATDPETGLPFHYVDSDAAFSGDVGPRLEFPSFQYLVALILRFQLTNSPLEFPAVFEPRSSQRAEVARREWTECEKDLNILLPAPKED